ncbi:Transducin (Alpha subunit), insertion [Venustampulla echinocandica]|uniref:Transducin (Alpha subunit), insertion n=1 Tax=Venustampulla echinocandica TaxID=2656787 RepID=A0A370U0M7_9HELO|nr:Transducin (Alpha subunit), insertion [Venustampulla echinocandica]RDL41329.1 Transducin (Alpha subunit), insertion [Venustampulla echinocandica]
MDPISVIGLAESLVGISDIIAKSLRRLINLQSRYRSASLVVSLLIGQLTTLKAAVNQITEWAGSSLFNTPKNEQVVADLKTSLESCKLLILVLEERISQLERDTSGSLNVKGKVEFLWEESDLKEFSNHLNNQANALNLLLTALHCRTTFERNALLQDDESRRIIKRVEDNRASLLSLRDSASENTRRSKLTDNSNLLDTEFDFDQEVVTTRVYRAALRSTLQRATRREKLPELTSDIHGGFNSIPEAVKSPGRVLENPHNSEPGPSHTALSSKQLALQSPQAFSGFRRWFQTDGAILQTTEVDQFSSRLSMLSSDSRPGDDASVFSFESQGRNDEGRPGQASNFARPLLRSQKAAKDKQLEAKRMKRRSNTSRIRKIFTVHSSMDVPPDEALGPDPEVWVEERPPKVVVVGSGNSGKSTLFKSMDALCKGGWTIEERLRFQEAVFTNAVQNMKDILEAMDTLGVLLNDDHNTSHAHTIMMQPSALGAGCFPPDVCKAIEALWQDRGVRHTFERSNEYILQDAAAYEPGYIPTDEDVIMARIRSTGLYSTTLRSGGISFKLTDTGGERSERKKWIHAFENISIVIFAVDISAYDLGLYEDLHGNRLEEDLSLFESIAGSKWFVKSQIILLFTKMDILEAKIKKVPIEMYCPDFTGNGNSLEDVKSYIERRFLAVISNPERTVRTIFASFVNGYNSSAKLVLDVIVSQLSPGLDGLTI